MTTPATQAERDQFLVSAYLNLEGKLNDLKLMAQLVCNHLADSGHEEVEIFAAGHVYDMANALHDHWKKQWEAAPQTLEMIAENMAHVERMAELPSTKGRGLKLVT